MKKIIAMLMLIAGVAGADNSALNTLVDAEKSFSKTSEQKGVKGSFVEYFADDSVVFRPGPVNGKKFYSDQAERPGLLTWRPVIADISSNGDLGYTTGPWEFRKNGKDDPQVFHGYYFSIWKKQPDGSWKVALDHGIGSQGPSKYGVELVKAPGVSSGKEKASNTTPADILKFDQQFSEQASKGDLKDAYQQHSVSDVVFLREGNEPMTGQDAILFLGSQGDCTWQPAKADLSGDFAYDYGSGHCSAKDKSENANYVRVWKKQSDGSWKVTVDVWSPIEQ